MQKGVEAVECFELVSQMRLFEMEKIGIETFLDRVIIEIGFYTAGRSIIIRCSVFTARLTLTSSPIGTSCRVLLSCMAKSVNMCTGTPSESYVKYTIPDIDGRLTSRHHKLLRFRILLWRLYRLASKKKMTSASHG